MRHSLFICLLAVPVIAGIMRESAGAPGQMNVLLITADDLGLQLSCYGESLIQTPNLDKFATSGVQFDIAYVAQASCSPSRSAMFTGLHTHSTGQYGLTNGGFSLHPELRDKTIPNLLKKAGYRTGIIGKLHVAPERSFQFDYRPRGNTREVRWVASAADQFLDETGNTPFFLMVKKRSASRCLVSPRPKEWIRVPSPGTSRVRGEGAVFFSLAGKLNGIGVKRPMSPQARSRSASGAYPW